MDKIKEQFLKIYFKLFTVNKGLIKDVKDSRDYVYGFSGIEKEIIRPDGQWQTPEGEIQRGTIESMSCTSQSLLNVVEMINLNKWKETKDYSDRFLAKCSGTTHNGNTMRTVLETLRKNFGTVREEQWKADYSSWWTYYAGIPQNILNLGKLWIKSYELQYEEVPLNKTLMMDALKYSPLYVSGFAWHLSNGLYRSYGGANHAFTLVGYKENKYWLAFDSYDEFLKKLDWNFRFGNIKSVLLKKKENTFNKELIKRLRDRGFDFVMRVLGDGQVYKLEDDKLVKVEPQEIKDMTINDLSKSKKLIGIDETFYNSLLE